MPDIAPYRLRRASKQDGPAVWALISGVPASHGIAPEPQTTAGDLAGLDAHYWRAGGAWWREWKRIVFAARTV